MGGHHHHDESIHANAKGSSRLRIVLFIVISIMVAEIIGGLLSNSLALLSDAGHMLVDALALGLAMFAITMARRPATLTRTFGYHRVEIMTALANGVTLVILALWIFYEAYQRFLEPPAVKTPVMLVVAVIGLIANLSGMLLLRSTSQHQLNIKAAFWHIIGDTLSSVGVIIGAIIISVTGWYVADPIIAVLIGLIILTGAVAIVRESADILLEAVPKHLQLDDVIQGLKGIPGVEDVHDIHIWTITSQIHALSAHLIVNDQQVSKSSDIMAEVNRLLNERFDITHTTLQLECEKCETCPEGFVCNISHMVHRTNGEISTPAS